MTLKSKEELAVKEKSCFAYRLEITIQDLVDPYGPVSMEAGPGGCAGTITR